MGSQNHIYSKKKLVKLKRGQSARGRLQPGHGPAVALTTGRGRAGGGAPRAVGSCPPWEAAQGPGLNGRGFLGWTPSAWGGGASDDVLDGGRGDTGVVGVGCCPPQT